ncbi:MAG: hypothetical protein ACRERD_33730 [Candidatus Binatia bacterium]
MLLLAGLGYAWTFTPSYSLFRIKYALEAHDYDTFSRYVDVDSVLDHALDEFGGNPEQEREEANPEGLLGKALRKGFLKNFARDARPVVKAGLRIVVEQTVKNRDHPLPQIPFAAVVGALWYGRTDEGNTVSFPIKIKKGEHIQIKARQTPAGLWRVVEVSDLSAFLSTIKSRRGLLSVDKPRAAAP